MDDSVSGQKKVKLLLSLFTPRLWKFVYNYQRGLWAMTSCNYPTAIRRLSSCLGLVPGYHLWEARIHQALGCCYFDIGENDKAKIFLLRFLEVMPEEKEEKTYGTGSEVASRLGVIYAKEGDYDKAKDYLEAALRCKPKPLTDSRTFTNWEMVDEWLALVNQKIASTKNTQDSHFLKESVKEKNMERDKKAQPPPKSHRVSFLPLLIAGSTIAALIVMLRQDNVDWVRVSWSLPLFIVILVLIVRSPIGRWLERILQKNYDITQKALGRDPKK